MKGPMKNNLKHSIKSLIAVASLVIFTTVSFADELERFGGQNVVPAQPQTLEQPTSRPTASAPVFFSANPTDHLTAPDARAAMRINPEAPGPFIGLAEAYFRGDGPVAKLYARQFVRYLTDMMFAVKDITSLIGEAMIEQGQIDDEEWVGVEQYLDYELTKARNANGSMLKATNEDALKRITPDPKGEIEIYYFFTLNSSFARKMAPDVERLWRIAKKDPRIKMVALTLGAQPKEFIESYRKYTGLTVPIFNGELVAKTFNVAFVPALVVVSPNLKTVYLKTGQQSFERLYKLVRTAQGDNPELSKEALALMKQKIGKSEPVSNQRIITTSSSSRNGAEVGLSRISYSQDTIAEQGLSKF